MRLSVFEGCVIIVVCLTQGSAVYRVKRNACSPFNICDISPMCINGGTCRRNESTCKYRCECPPDYTGNLCETFVEDSDLPSLNSTCDEDGCSNTTQCYNGGTCVWNETTCSQNCQCAEHFSGEFCNETNSNQSDPSDTSTQSVSSDSSSHNCPYNPCLTNPCINGGTCVQHECQVRCSCPPNFTGDICADPFTVTTQHEDWSETPASTTQRQIDNCGGGFMCLHGKCRFYENKFVFCDCDDGFIGAFCHIPCDLKCGENGICYRANRTAPTRCHCNYPFTGPRCNETNSNQSDPSDTSTQSVSTDSSSHNCPYNLCLTNPCINGGTCVQHECQVRCTCPPNFTGDICADPFTVTTQLDWSETPASTTQRQIDNCGGGFMCLYGNCSLNENKSVFCDCDDGFIGTFCHIPCDLKCGENGICDRANRTAPTRCVCKNPFTGPLCQEVITQPPPTVANAESKYWIIGSCLVLLLLLGLLLGLAFFLMKKRNIFIMRVLYYFQPYEDEDGKLFDAFISYKSDPEDERFVYRTLYPELEVNRGYKLCLHHRDFRVGETIANNILWAIENSRRTILVMSPQYMESDFTRFEYQVAHDEMLKLKHKVIPLLLEDISQKKHLMDQTLASILKSITYIEWPRGESDESFKKFWTRLELSLPKRKSSSESSTSESYPVLSFDNSTFSAEPCDLDMVSVYPDCKTSEDNTERGKDGRAKKQAVYDETKRNDDPGQTYLALNNQDVKPCFNEPVTEEVFNNMRNKAIEYGNCLEI